MISPVHIAGIRQLRAEVHISAVRLEVQRLDALEAQSRQNHPPHIRRRPLKLRTGSAAAGEMLGNVQNSFLETCRRADIGDTQDEPPTNT